MNKSGKEFSMRQDKLIVGLLLVVFCLFSLAYWINKQNPLVEKRVLVQHGHSYYVTIHWAQHGRSVNYSVEGWPERTLVENGMSGGMIGEPQPPFVTPYGPNPVRRVKLALHMDEAP